MKTNTTHKMLRRLAPRSLRVYERHAGKEPGLEAFATSLVLHATAFITDYDAVREYAARRFMERQQGKKTIEDLLRKMRIWSPQVARDLPTVSVGEFGDNPDVPDEVLRDAKSLLEHATHTTEGGEPLPYADALASDLGAAIEAAQAQWGQAESAADGMIGLQSATRTSAAAFEQDLIAFRRALAATIGRSHPDYQKLRVDRARVVDSEDDPNAPAATEVDQEPDPVEDSQSDMEVNAGSGDLGKVGEEEAAE
jgi:hypothetical protein